jgi:hypothetical protein
MKKLNCFQSASWLSALALSVALLASGRTASASTDRCTITGAGVVPVTETCVGKSYADWSAAFWQYVLAQPVTTNPLLDTTGATCRVGQSGQVFFLVGSFVGVVDRRECAVPAGKTLFFPLVNIVDLNTPAGACRALQNAQCAPETPDQLRADIQPIEDGATQLNASVDGTAVQSLATFRIASPNFSVFLPADSLLAPLAAHSYLAVADGYYLLVAPLRSGAHIVRFGGTDGTGFTQNITYRFTIP